MNRYILLKSLDPGLFYVGSGGAVWCVVLLCCFDSSLLKSKSQRPGKYFTIKLHNQTLLKCLF